MSLFLLSINDNSREASAFINYIKSLSIAKLQAISAAELDKKILNLNKSIRAQNINEKEILQEVKKHRKSSK